MVREFGWEQVAIVTQIGNVFPNVGECLNIQIFSSLLALQVENKYMNLVHPSMYRSQTIEVWIMCEATLFSWQAMWLHNEHRVYTS